MFIIFITFVFYSILKRLDETNAIEKLFFREGFQIILRCPWPDAEAAEAASEVISMCVLLDLAAVQSQLLMKPNLVKLYVDALAVCSIAAAKNLWKCFISILDCVDNKAIAKSFYEMKLIPVAISNANASDCELRLLVFESLTKLLNVIDLSDPSALHIAIITQLSEGNIISKICKFIVELFEDQLPSQSQGTNSSLFDFPYLSKAVISISNENLTKLIYCIDLLGLLTPHNITHAKAREEISYLVNYVAMNEIQANVSSNQSISAVSVSSVNSSITSDSSIDNCVTTKVTITESALSLCDRILQGITSQHLNRPSVIASSLSEANEISRENFIITLVRILNSLCSQISGTRGLLMKTYAFVDSCIRIASQSDSLMLVSESFKLIYLFAYHTHFGEVLYYTRQVQGICKSAIKYLASRNRPNQQHLPTIIDTFTFLMYQIISHHEVMSQSKSLEIANQTWPIKSIIMMIVEKDEVWALLVQLSDLREACLYAARFITVLASYRDVETLEIIHNQFTTWNILETFVNHVQSCSSTSSRNAPPNRAEDFIVESVLFCLGLLFIYILSFPFDSINIY